MQSAKSKEEQRHHFQLSTFSFQLLLGLALLIGHLLPWASHTTTALTLTGNDLAFFTHFTPGAGGFRNEWFYLPVWISAIQFTRAAAHRKRFGRIIGLISSWAVAALALPRYQFLIGLRDAVRQNGLSAWVHFEFGLQLAVTVLLMVVCALVLSGTLTRRGKLGLVTRTQARLEFLLDFLCVLGCLVPLFGLLSIQNAIETLYQSKIALGTGGWLHFIAIIGLALSGSAKIKVTFMS